MGGFSIGGSALTNTPYAFGLNPANTAQSYAAMVGSDPTSQTLFSNYNYGTDGVGMDAAIGPYSGAYNYALGSGYGDMIGGFGFPMMGMGMGGNPIQQAQMWGQYSNTMLDIQTQNSVYRAQKERYADLKVNGPQAVVQHEVELINGLVAEGRYDQIYPAYNELLGKIRSMYPGIDEDSVKMIANKFCPLVAELSSANPFLENITKGLGFGVGALFTSGKDSRDVRAEITGVPVSFRDKLTKYAGWAVGALLTLGAVMLFRGKGLSKLNPARWFSKGGNATAAPAAAAT